MKQDHKTCAYCYYFRAYYTRAYCCLLREKNGYCAKHEKVAEKCDSCDMWCGRRTSKAKRIKIVLSCLPEIYYKIAVVEQLLKEETGLQKIRDEKM